MFRASKGSPVLAHRFSVRGRPLWENEKWLGTPVMMVFRSVWGALSVDATFHVRGARVYAKPRRLAGANARLAATELSAAVKTSCPAGVGRRWPGWPLAVPLNLLPETVWLGQLWSSYYDNIGESSLIRSAGRLGQ